MYILYFYILRIVKVLILLHLLIFPSVVISEDIETFANRLFHHYKYDEKVNNYLKSFFSSKYSDNKLSLQGKKNFSYNNSQSEQQTFKIKSKNKMIFNFGNGQSLQMNPSDIKNKIIYSRNHYSYFEFKKDSVSYGINLKF